MVRLIGDPIFPLAELVEHSSAGAMMVLVSMV